MKEFFKDIRGKNGRGWQIFAIIYLLFAVISSIYFGCGLYLNF